jgi:hypothetical protein
VFTIAVAILFGVRTVSASAKDLPCSDLRKAKAARLVGIFATAPLPDGMVFSHGLGCYTEDEEFPNPCDWKVAVSEDRNLSEDRRLIVVNTEHMTGQGAQAEVLVFGCRAGKVTAALLDQTFNREVAVEEASADKLVLKFARWESCDAVCCPSTEVRQVYMWSKDAQDYVLDREIAKSFAPLINTCGKKSQ